MKKIFLMLMVLSSAGMMQAKDIQLPQPRKQGGMPLLEALNNRQSAREMSEELFRCKHCPICYGRQTG